MKVLASRQGIPGRRRGRLRRLLLGLILLVAGGLALSSCGVAETGYAPPASDSAEVAANSAISGARFVDFAAHLAVDLVAILLMAYGIYFRRHARRDLLMTYMAFNVGLFIVLTVISINQATLGVGFGLFAILSLIRLRSEPFSNTELGYFFIAMVVAVVNALQVGRGLEVTSVLLSLCLNAAALLVLYVMDHPALQSGAGQRQVILDAVYDNDDALRADLERRLRVRVASFSVSQVDYVRETTQVDVRYVRRSEPGISVVSSRESTRVA